MSAPRIAVFDSGLGGLSVLRVLRETRPDADYAYIADTAGFPYGGRSEDDIVARVTDIFDALEPFAPDLAVIACNTASTLVLPHLRARFPYPFVGTVPAIKPAAAATRSGLVSVLATPGTVARDYTHGLVRTHASHVHVRLVGSFALASLAEAILCGEPVSDEALAQEIAGAFVEEDGKRTDIVVLGCTHYPLIHERLVAVAPWRVEWMDPAPAIARRVDSLLKDRPRTTAPGKAISWVTGAASAETPLSMALRRFGLPAPSLLPRPAMV